jgi:hypothetical protein
MATDTLRAKLMEVAGYQSQVLEFIDMEHTPKNLLLRCTRRQPSSSALTSAMQDVQSLRRSMNLPEMTLEQRLRQFHLIQNTAAGSDR